MIKNPAINGNHIGIGKVNRFLMIVLSVVVPIALAAFECMVSIEDQATHPFSSAVCNVESSPIMLCPDPPRYLGINVKRGEKVRVFGAARDTPSRHLLISLYQGVRGWVDSDHFTLLEKPIEGIIPNPNWVTSLSANSEFVNLNGLCVANHLRIRRGPGTGYDIIGALNRGDSFEVVAKSTFTQTLDGKLDAWYLVRPSPIVQGWVFGAYLNIGIPGKRLPIDQQRFARIFESDPYDGSGPALSPYLPGMVESNVSVTSLGLTGEFFRGVVGTTWPYLSLNMDDEEGSVHGAAFTWVTRVLWSTPVYVNQGDIVLIGGDDVSLQPLKSMEDPVRARSEWDRLKSKCASQYRVKEGREAPPAPMIEVATFEGRQISLVYGREYAPREAYLENRRNAWGDRHHLELNGACSDLVWVDPQMMQSQTLEGVRRANGVDFLFVSHNHYATGNGWMAFYCTGETCEDIMPPGVDVSDPLWVKKGVYRPRMEKP